MPVFASSSRAEDSSGIVSLIRIAAEYISVSDFCFVSEGSSVWYSAHSRELSESLPAKASASVLLAFAAAVSDMQSILSPARSGIFFSSRKRERSFRIRAKTRPDSDTSLPKPRKIKVKAMVKKSFKENRISRKGIAAFSFQDFREFPLLSSDVIESGIPNGL